MRPSISANHTRGSALAALDLSVATTVIGAVLAGSVLGSPGHLLLAHPRCGRLPQRRPEMFALLRTANAAGVIFARAVLTVVSLSVALIVVTRLMIVATLAVAMASAGRPWLRSG